MPIAAAVILLHWLNLMVSLHNYTCVVKSPGLNQCLLLTTCNTRLNVTCTQRHMDIATVDSGCNGPITAKGTHLPQLEEAWTKCFNFQRPSTAHQSKPSMKLRIRLSDNEIKTFPDEYFCHLPIDHLIIYGNSLIDTRKLGFSPVENCDKPCLTSVQTLQVEQTNLTKVYNDSFCGLDTLIELHLTYSEINELEIDAFTHLKSLQRMGLKKNNISTLPIGVFRYQQNTLLHLDMSNNRLDSKSMMELKILKSLESLNLEGNRIDVLPIEVIKEMTQLSDLKIGNNQITNCAGVIPLSKNLRSLDVQSNRISHIQLHFPRSSKLRILNIQNNPIIRTRYQYYPYYVNVTHVDHSNTSLTTIPDYIKVAKNIKSIVLSRNYIHQIEFGTFDAGEDIDLIDLSYNQLSDITDIFTRCTVKQLHLDHNRINKFAFDNFSFNLTLLSITHNRIHTVDVAPRVNLNDFQWSLKTLNLSNNRIKDLETLRLPPSLTTFDVRNNHINFISHHDDYITLSNRNQTSPRHIHLENNAFKVICPKFILPNNRLLEYYFNGNPLLCSCENRWLSSTANATHADLMNSAVADRDTLACQYEFQRTGNQPKLISQLNDPDIYCSLTNSACDCDINRVACNVQCPPQCQCHKPTYSDHFYVDCSSKGLIDLPLTSTDFNETRELYVYLDDNTIYKLNSSSLLGLNNTIGLYLNWTSLTEMEDGSFDHLTVLSILHLDHNSLSHISDNIFKGLSSLTQLFLSHNQIQTVASNAFPSQLQTVHLDNNQLVNYSVWQLDDVNNNVKSASIETAI